MQGRPRLAEAALAGLVGQECTVIREGFGEQLVVGFGNPSLGEWPLRETLKAPWLLYSRYGAWNAHDGVREVASDAEDFTNETAQRLRAVILRQHVSDVSFDTADAGLRLTFENGATLGLQQHDDDDPDEEAWAIHAPGDLLIEGRRGNVEVTKRVGTSTRGSTNRTGVHELLRSVAERGGFHLFEPPLSADHGFDAVFTASDGTVLLVAMKSSESAPQPALYAVAVRRDVPSSTGTQIPLDDLSVETVTEQLRHLLTAA